MEASFSVPSGKEHNLEEDCKASGRILRKIPWPLWLSFFSRPRMKFHPKTNYHSWFLTPPPDQAAEINGCSCKDSNSFRNMHVPAKYTLFKGHVAGDHRRSGKDSLGWSIMCWLPWFSDLGCWWRPTSRASSRSLRVCPWPSICFHGPSGKVLDLLPPASLAPPKTGRRAHVFGSTRGHTPRRFSGGLRVKNQENASALSQERSSCNTTNENSCIVDLCGWHKGLYASKRGSQKGFAEGSKKGS